MQKKQVGIFFFFLDGDMELIPGFWSEVIKDGKMVYPFLSGIEKDVMFDGNWEYQYTRVRRKFTVGVDRYEVTTGGLFMVKKELWYKTGAMDDRLKRCQDLDFGFRMTKLGYKLCRKPLFWVNHYTRDYEVRTDQSSFLKYTALLLRKHFFNLSAQKFLLGPNYTVWTFVLCVILSFAFHSLLPYVLYLLALGYRTFRAYQRNRDLVNPFIIFVNLVKFDFLFIYYFITFWPRDSRIGYKVL